MTILSRKRWLGLLIFAAFAPVFGAGVVGGIEWAFAALGVITLIGITGTGIYVLAKVLRRSDTSLKGGCPECGSTPGVSSDSDDLKHVTYSKPVEAELITEEDERLIIEHLNELFEIGREQSGGKPAEAEAITEEDERLIMELVNDLFAKGR